MIYLYIFLVVWLSTAYPFWWWNEVRYYKKNPHAWNTRMNGLISFTDRQKKWIYAFWPFALGLAVAYLLLIWCLAGLEKVIEFFEKDKA